MRVLIVEDSSLIQERLVKAVSSIPEVSEVLVARTLKEASEVIEKEPLDAITLDLRLPDGSGLVLLERIAKVQQAGKVIVLTNFPYQEYRQYCERFGVFRFLDKSDEFDKLSQTIRELMEKKKNMA